MLKHIDIRRLLKAKHYYLTIIFTLSLTLSLVFSVFSIIDTIYLKPLPYSKPSELYKLEGLITYQGATQTAVNPVGLFHVKDNSQLIQEMAIYMSLGKQKIYSIADRPEIPIFFASPDFFKLVKAEPELGRFFNDLEKTGNKQPSAILSYEAWHQFYDGSSDILGQKIHLDQKSYTVIGITPKGWVLPNMTGVAGGIWLPLDMGGVNPRQYKGFTSNFGSIVRISKEVPLNKLKEEIEPLYYRGAELSLPDYTKMLKPKPEFIRLSDAIRGDSVKVTVMLAIGVMLLLLIAIINLANVHLGRAVRRVQLLAISYACGATPKQLFRELFIHNFTLISLSTILSLVLTAASFHIIKNLGAESIPRLESIGISLNMALFAIVIATIVSMIFTIIEIKLSTPKKLSVNLQVSGKGKEKQISKGWSHLLIAMQLCFSIIILSATSQVLFSTLSEVLRPTNIKTEDLWTIKIGLENISDDNERININRSIFQYFENKPEVKSVSYSSEMRIDVINRNFIYNDNNEQISSARRIVVDTKYFDIFDMKIRGKKFTEEEGQLEYHPVIINQRLADLIPGNPIGQQIILDDKKTHKIIGISSNNDYPGASFREDEEVFIPGNYEGWRNSVFTIKTESSSKGFSKRVVLEELLKLDPRLDLKVFDSVSNQFSKLSENHRFSAYIAAGISIVSFTIVLAGIFGIVTYLIKSRSFDLGVKVAMGATNKVLLKSELIEILTPIIYASLFSFSFVFFALGYSRTVPGWFFDIQWSLIASTVILLILFSSIVSILPIANMLKSNPIKLLRNE